MPSLPNMSAYCSHLLASGNSLYVETQQPSVRMPSQRETSKPSSAVHTLIQIHGHMTRCFELSGGQKNGEVGFNTVSKRKSKRRVPKRIAPNQ